MTGGRSWLTDSLGWRVVAGHHVGVVHRSDIVVRHVEVGRRASRGAARAEGKHD